MRHFSFTRSCLFALNLLWLLILALPGQADVILSELCDPRHNYQPDRFIEIFNSGGTTESLSGWSVVALGNDNEIFTWDLSGTIAPGQALVCGDATTVTDFPVDFALEAWSDNNSTWNGKSGDGAKLRNASGEDVDVVLATGTLFENADMVRHEDVSSGSTSFDAAEWTVTPVYTPEEASPGSHNGSGGGDGPEIFNVWTDPQTPGELDPVTVKAAIEDDGLVDTVSARWGTSEGNLTNALTMSLESGNVYVADAVIPGQNAGVRVYIQVSATDDEANTTDSEVMSYSIAQEVTIGEIQGGGDSSPLVGQLVTCSGVVTADFGAHWVIQDGIGVRTGLWVSGDNAPLVGSLVQVAGQVAEVDGNTTLTDASVVTSSMATEPAMAIISADEARSEDYEGVLVQVQNATCTTYNEAAGYWFVENDGSTVRVDNLGVDYAPTVGNVYDVSGPVSDNTSFNGIVPRDADDVVFVSDPSGPELIGAEASGPNSVILSFSEPVDGLDATDASQFTVSGSTVQSSVRMGSETHRVQLTVTTMGVGAHTATVEGLNDLFGNPSEFFSADFQYDGGNVPAGYYDGTEGLAGNALRVALHEIIDNHNSISYSAIWNAFEDTDARPDGTVWDMYSDVPDGTPPYVYDFFVDQGSGSSEGSGYNREHSWPHSWYGSHSPMYTDLFMVYPTDSYVNNRRGNYPFGEVRNATWTSQNGCKLGSCDYPGYSGMVFEPIDEYKGDFARAYFYMGVRYYNEDGGWSGSPMVNGAQLKPWAEAMLLEWHFADPVSQKEIHRNDAVYAYQHNRNPFIDRPDFVSAMFGVSVSDAPETPLVASILLYQNTPNPFNPNTNIRYELQDNGPVDLQVFDMKGRLVRTLVSDSQSAGPHEAIWNGRDEQGMHAAAGVYFYRLRSDGGVQTRRMTLVK